MTGMSATERPRGRPPGDGLINVTAIKEVGTRLIFEQGYECMTLRDLASELGVKPASLYNHIDSKQALLAELVEQYTAEMADGLEGALEGVIGPANRLKAFVSYHIGFHTRRIVQASICLTELRHLQGARRATVQRLRDGYEARLRAIIHDGIEQRVFGAVDERLAAFAILGMITSVIGWYRPGGRCTPQELSDAYGAFALAALRPEPG